MSLADSMALRALHQCAGLSVDEVRRRRHEFPAFTKYSKATVYRHAKKPIGQQEPLDARKNNKGRPRKLTDRDKRNIKRCVPALRESHGSFSSQILQREAQMEQTVSNSTFRRYLRRMGYGYRVARKKGMLLQRDLKSRMRWCRRAHKHKHLWTEGVAMYIDAVGFEFKTNPFEHAKALGAREWRLASEGVNFKCTAKGKKEGMVCVRFMVGIATEHGVVLCRRIKRRMNGADMAKMVDAHFPAALRRTGKKCNRVLQDGCPVQNSRRAHRAMHRHGIKVFRIPARSPDLNPIENFFHTTPKHRIVCKTFSEYL